MRKKVELEVDTTDKGHAEEMLGEPLTPVTLSMVRIHMAHILVNVGFDSPIDVDTLRTQLPLALNHPRFLSLLVEDTQTEGLKWVEISNVNIDDHVIVPNISPALRSDSLEGDKFVEDYLHRLTETSMDKSKPLWEIHFLNVKTSEAKSVMIIRIHHCLGDGISITSHILAWARQLSNPDALPTIATMKKKEKNNTVDIAHKNRRFWSFVLVVWWWIQVFWNTVIDVLMFFATVFFFKDSAMITMANSETNVIQRKIVYKIVSLDDVKLIKNAMNVTINDVAIGIIEAGLSRYLIRRLGNKHGKTMKANDKLYKKIRMRMAMIVNLRPLKGIQGLEDIKNKDSKLGLRNQVGYVIVPLSIRLEDDPLEYVRKAKATVDRKKHSFEAIATAIFSQITAKLFGIKVAGSMTKKVFSNVSITVSNVPGPLEEIALFGHSIKFIAPTVYGFPSPIMIHLQSCTNKMAIVISVREDVVVDPHELSDNIVEALLLIKQAVLEE